MESITKNCQPGEILVEPEQVRRGLYCLHLMLIMVIETVYRGHSEPRQHDWARGQRADVMGAARRSAWAAPPLNSIR